MLTVRTDHKWRYFLLAPEVPPRVLLENFGWLIDDVDPREVDPEDPYNFKVGRNWYTVLDEEGGDGSYFKYQGTWYHLSQFMRPPAELSRRGWDGYLNDSFFSGIVIKLAPDGEEFQVGTFMA